MAKTKIAMRSTLLLSILFLSSCSSGARYAINNYKSVPVVRFAVTDGSTYRIFHKPSEKRLMITPSLAAAAGQGALQGISLGAINSGRPVILYEDAAIQFLASKGSRCQVTKSFLVVKPQYEIRYECDENVITKTNDTHFKKLKAENPTW